MSSDKTLATAKHGGCVQLGDGLPALPDTDWNARSDGSEPLYSAEQMRDYARATLDARPENVAADTYWSLADLIEPYVAREGINPDGGLPASVYESVQVLLEHWIATQTSPGGQDALAVIEELAELNRACAALDPDYKGPSDAAVQAAIAALAARQPVGEPVAWEVRRSDGSPLACWEACTQDAFEATKRTGRYLGYENGPLCEVRALIAAPPAQAVDLGQFRAAVYEARCSHEAMERKAEMQECDRLLALIDGKAEVSRG